MISSESTANEPTPPLASLYPQELPQLQRGEYDIIIAECKRLGAKTALEFGPGSTTLALIEAGLERIITCEYVDKWFDHAKEQFKDYPQVGGQTRRRYSSSASGDKRTVAASTPV